MKAFRTVIEFTMRAGLVNLAMYSNVHGERKATMGETYENLTVEEAFDVLEQEIARRHHLNQLELFEGD